MPLPPLGTAVALGVALELEPLATKVIVAMGNRVDSEDLPGHMTSWRHAKRSL